MYKDDVSIYIDMDGTLVEYEEEYLKRGIYENAIPHDEIVKLARLLNLEGYDVWFLLLYLMVRIGLRKRNLDGYTSIIFQLKMATRFLCPSIP